MGNGKTKLYIAMVLGNGMYTLRKGDTSLREWKGLSQDDVFEEDDIKEEPYEQ